MLPIPVPETFNTFNTFTTFINNPNHSHVVRCLVIRTAAEPG